MNKERSILVICNTPFQIIVACYILQLFYPLDCVDLCVSKGISGAEQLVQNARKTNRFRSVRLLNVKKTFRSSKGWIHTVSYVIQRITEIVRTLFIARTISREKYDVILFSNISILTKRLTTLLTHTNPACKLELFEEGTITYTRQFTTGDDLSTPYRRFIDRRGVLDRLATLYVFNPQFLAWKPSHGNVTKLPKLADVTVEFITLINTIFAYETCVDKYDRKLIFFEESHVMEGFDVPDIQIVNQIAHAIGKENIMVKIHPRNSTNRFTKLGYKTNTNTAIPWELIMLNQPMKDKILVTISSGAVIYPYLYFGIPTKTYSLMYCLSELPGLMKGENGQFMQTIYATYPDIFIAPKSIVEFINMLGC